MTLVLARDAAPAYRIRPMVGDDVGYVVDSWTHETGRMSRVTASARRGLVLDGARRMARHAVATATVLVACSARSDSTILGWVCGLRGETFAVHVRWDMRRRGIGRALTTALREQR